MDIETAIKYFIIIILFSICGYLIYMALTDIKIMSSKIKEVEGNLLTTQSLVQSIMESLQQGASNPNVNSAYTGNLQNDVLNQFMSNTEELKYLLKNQTEIEGAEEGDSSDEEDDSSDEEGELESDSESELESESTNSSLDSSVKIQEIESLSEVPLKKKKVTIKPSVESLEKCESILKSGKNKGNKCDRNVLDDTKFCKLHQLST